MPLTDAEIICMWMEPKPQGEAPLSLTFRGDLDSPGRFWVAFEYSTTWQPRPLTLDALWEVEERLTDVELGWYGYFSKLYEVTHAESRLNSDIRICHATPEQKIKALASVLRPIVESGEKT